MAERSSVDVVVAMTVADSENKYCCGERSGFVVCGGGGGRGVMVIGLVVIMVEG